MSSGPLPPISISPNIIQPGPGGNVNLIITSALSDLIQSHNEYGCILLGVVPQTAF